MPDKHEKHLALLNALNELRECRQERDDALRAVEELQQQLADSQALSRVGTWRREVETGVIHWSEQTYRIHGIEPGTPLSREMVIGMIHENDRERVQAEVDMAILERRPYRLIFRIRRPDSEVRILHADNMVSSGGTHGATTVFGAVHDITDSPLPSANRQVHHEQIPESSLIIDPSGIIVRHSGAFSRRVRHLDSGSSVFRLFTAEESHDVLADAMDEVETEMSVRRIALAMEDERNKEERLFELRPWLPLGDWWGFVLTEVDQTEKNGTGPSIARSKRTVQVDAGAWETELKTGSTIWSRSIYDILERDPGEDPLSESQFFELVHEDDLDEMMRLYERLVKTKLPIENQFRIRVPSGAIKTLRVHAEYLNRTETHSHLMGTMTDISKTADLQHAARVSELRERRLSHLLHSSREELMMASLRLQTAQEQERLRIAGELHDEAGGLLTALNLTLSELQNGQPQPVMDRATSLLDQLTEQIRATTRKLRPSVLDHFGLSHGLEQLAEDMASLGGWHLELELTSTTQFIESEVVDAVFGIAREALLNALKHADATVVRVRLSRSPGGLELEIEDDGCGLPESVYASTSSGLGLITMRDRAEALGGSVRIQAREAKGTHVFAFLPFPNKNNSETMS